MTSSSRNTSSSQLPHQPTPHLTLATTTYPPILYLLILILHISHSLNTFSTLRGLAVRDAVYLTEIRDFDWDQRNWSRQEKLSRDKKNLVEIRKSGRNKGNLIETRKTWPRLGKPGRDNENSTETRETTIDGLIDRHINSLMLKPKSVKLICH